MVTLLPIAQPLAMPRVRASMGQTMAEYALVLALVSVGVMAAINTFGGSVDTAVTTMKADVATQAEPTTVAYVAPDTMTASGAGNSYIGAQAGGVGAASGSTQNNGCTPAQTLQGCPW